jgi:hypothetical protein
MAEIVRSHRAELARDLMSAAICHTDNPADAATALVLAAGEVLRRRFGEAAAFALLRSVIEETEAAFLAIHGRQGCETVQ